MGLELFKIEAEKKIFFKQIRNLLSLNKKKSQTNLLDFFLNILLFACYMQKYMYILQLNFFVYAVSQVNTKCTAVSDT